MKGQDRGLNSHRYLSFSWSGRGIRKSVFSSLTYSSAWVMHPRDGDGRGFDETKAVLSLTVAS